MTAGVGPRPDPVAKVAADALRAALDAAGIFLPTLAPEIIGTHERIAWVDLGRARPDDVHKLAALILRGVGASAAERPVDAGGVPEIGALAYDMGRMRVGEVMGRVGPYVQLRPLVGGLEWDVVPEKVRALTAREELSARLAVRNARTRREVRGK